MEFDGMCDLIIGQLYFRDPAIHSTPIHTLDYEIRGGEKLNTMMYSESNSAKSAN